MSIENSLSKLRHSVGVLCILRRELLGVFLRISAGSFQVARPAENCPKFSIILLRGDMSGTKKKWRGVLLGYFPQKTSPKIRQKL